MAGKRFKLPKPGEVYLDTVKNAYFRITGVLEADVRVLRQRGLTFVYEAIKRFKVEASPEFFTNMYVLKVNSGLAVIYKNFDVVHASCRLASPTELIGWLGSIAFAIRAYLISHIIG